MTSSSWAKSAALLFFLLAHIGWLLAEDVGEEEALSPREKKVFSLLTQVTFANDECQGNSADTLGTCLTSKECTDQSGNANGNCAAGFGVCCELKVSNCSTTVSKNITYIVNPGYSSSYKDVSKACKYTIKAINSDICQLKLNFTKMIMTNPNAQGACVDAAVANLDNLAITSPGGNNPPVICGTSSGTHMYIDVGGALTDTELVFTTGDVATFDRQWKILVTQIECSSPLRAPTDCLQYFTTLSGTMTSYNNGGTTPLMLQSQTFSSCVRAAEGYCSIQYSQSAADTFQLNAAVAVSENENCMTAYVEIANSVDSASNMFCGAKLNNEDDSGIVGSVVQATGPFMINTRSKAANQMNQKGYSINFVQRPCV